MIAGVVKETVRGEKRVALTPAVIPSLTKAGLEVMIQAGAGEESGFADADYHAKGAKIGRDHAEVLAAAEVLCHVRVATGDRSDEQALRGLRAQHTVIGLADPLGASESIQ